MKINKLKKVSLIFGSLGTVFCLNCAAMNLPEDSGASSSSETPTVTTEVTERDSQNKDQSASSNTPSVYIPRQIDVSRTLQRESICCFRISRWFLQPLNVIAPLLSSGLVAFGEYYIDDNPRLAKILNGIGLGCSVAQFVTSVLLIKVNDKLEGIDNYMESRGKNNSESGIQMAEQK